jgi:hypothetical protein
MKLGDFVIPYTKVNSKQKASGYGMRQWFLGCNAKKHKKELH